MIIVTTVLLAPLLTINTVGELHWSQVGRVVAGDVKINISQRVALQVERERTELVKDTAWTLVTQH